MEIKNKVTVLMPVFNAEAFLKEAIESILAQTFTEFEFLIINDGSTDNSLNIINSYNDKRIRLINNDKNIKLIGTLNKGMALTNSDYIARMDADDISYPTRLEKQFNFMEKNPEIGLCGTFIRTLGLEKDYDIHYSTSHEEIKFNLFFDTHFPHPAAMLRKSVISENNLEFSNKYIHAEDFDFWNRLAEFTHIAIIPEILVLKRCHEDQISHKYLDVQKNISSEIRKEIILNKFGVTIDNHDIDIYDNWLNKILPKTKDDLFTLLDFIEKLIIANNKKAYYKVDIFNTYFLEIYWQLCTRNTQYGIELYKKFKDSEICKLYKKHKFSESKFFLKSIIKYGY